VKLGEVCNDNGVCVAEGDVCETDSDCDAGEVCNDNGVCVAECITNWGPWSAWSACVNDEQTRIRFDLN